MPTRENHYQLLGLDLSATSEQIEESLRRLGDEADKLAYSAPERSRNLWAQIRQIKGDLLSGSDRRYAYDCTVVDGWSGESEALETQSPHPRIPAMLPARPVARRERHRRAGEWLLALATGLILLAVALTWWVNRQPSRKHPTYASGVSIALSTNGFHHGSKFVSGQILQLSWSPVTGAQRYQGQIATWTSNPRSSAVFTHSLRTFQTSNTWYSLKIVGAQVYYWRVRALANGHWTAYSATHRFAVDIPRTQSPFTLIPENRALLVSTRVQICWSPILGAVGYHVRLRTVGGFDVRGTCVTRTLPPGWYHWTVAARVQGASIYVGPYSHRSYFTVRAIRSSEIAARQGKPRRSQIRQSTSRRTSNRKTTPSVAAPGTALVAVVIRVPAGTASTVQRSTAFTSSRVIRSAPVRQVSHARAQTTASNGTATHRQPVYGPRMHRVPAPPPPPTKKPVVTKPVPAAPATTGSPVLPVVAGGGFPVQGSGPPGKQRRTASGSQGGFYVGSSRTVVQAPVAPTRGVNPSTPRYATSTTIAARPVVTYTSPAPAFSPTETSAPTSTASPVPAAARGNSRSSGKSACVGKCRGR